MVFEFVPIIFFFLNVSAWLNRYVDFAFKKLNQELYKTWWLSYKWIFIPPRDFLEFIYELKFTWRKNLYIPIVNTGLRILKRYESYLFNFEF